MTEPEIDATAALAYLATLPPLDRITAADTYGDAARALVGDLARIRRAAIVEAVAQDLPLDLSDHAIREACRTDRQLLREALLVILEPGVCTARADQLQQGLADRIRIEAIARRVLHGAHHLVGGVLDSAQLQLIDQAAIRAGEILGER